MLIHRDRASGTLAVIKLSCCVLLTLCGDPCLAFFFVSWAHSPAVLRNLGPRDNRVLRPRTCSMAEINIADTQKTEAGLTAPGLSMPGSRAFKIVGLG
jgi:hypothetical protein